MTAGPPDLRRAELDQEVLAWMREPTWRDDEERFDRIARALFAFQFEHCRPYRNFCRGRGRTPATIDHWREIPPVPTGAFKEVPLYSFPKALCLHRFRTSGTSTSTQGTLHLDTLGLYEASLLPTFRRYVFPDLAAEGRAAIRILAPSSIDAPDSSLSHMFRVAMDALGSPASGFDVRDGALDYAQLFAGLEACAAEGVPVALCGTSFAFVHLLDELERRRNLYRLPEGSRVMECGGFKGRSRELPRAELYLRLEDALGVPMEMMVNQYGMTELASQFYDSVLVQPRETRRKLGPPWTRVVITDPASGEPAAPGAIGSVIVYDLANTGSILAIQTADLGRTVEDGFEVIGREPGAEERGCSIAADAMFADSVP